MSTRLITLAPLLFGLACNEPANVETATPTAPTTTDTTEVAGECTDVKGTILDAQNMMSDLKENCDRVLLDQNEADQSPASGSCGCERVEKNDFYRCAWESGTSKSQMIVKTVNWPGLLISPDRTIRAAFTNIHQDDLEGEIYLDETDLVGHKDSGSTLISNKKLPVVLPENGSLHNATVTPQRNFVVDKLAPEEDKNLRAETSAFLLNLNEDLTSSR